MRTAAEIAYEIHNLDDDSPGRAKLATILAEVRTRALTREVAGELYTLEFVYQSRHDGDYAEDEVDLAVKDGLDPAAHLAWLLKRANRCLEIARLVHDDAVQQ